MLSTASALRRYLFQAAASAFKLGFNSISIVEDLDLLKRTLIVWYSGRYVLLVVVTGCVAGLTSNMILH